MDAAAPLAIIAGSGWLPRRLAEHCRARGDRYVVFALREGGEAADAPHWSMAHPGHGFRLAEVDRLLAALVGSGCREVCLAGGAVRPAATELADAAARSPALAPILAGLAGGDDSLLRRVAGVIESRGLRVIGVEARLPELLAPAGAILGGEPDAGARSDIDRGRRIVRALGALDVGQAAVVAEGRCLAVETVEGTGAMLQRVAAMTRRAGAARGRGVLVKASKPGQDLRFDRPAVGPDTLQAAAAAGLAGVAVEAGEVLLLEGERTAALARGPFLFGFDRMES